MRLFGKRKEIEEPRETLQTEMKDLDKLAIEKESEDIPELPPELTEIKDNPESEVEELREKFEEPKTLQEPLVEIPEIEFDEIPLKDLNDRVDEEVKEIRKKMRDLGGLTKMTLESPEMIKLMDLYTSAKDKLAQFIEEIDKLDLTMLSSKKTFAAIYKFRACKGLSEIKRELRKMEFICKKAGFIPTKVHEILQSRAENLIDGFLHEKSKDE